VLFEGPRFPLILDRYTLSPAAAASAILGVRALEGARLPRNQAEVRRGRRPLPTAWPARIHHPDRQPWATNYNTYDFNPKQFDDAKQMIAHLHDEGYKMILWHTSWINQKTMRPASRASRTRSRPTFRHHYAEAERNGYFSTGRTARRMSTTGRDRLV